MAKYSDYTPAAALSGAEFWACTQSAATFKVTATQVKTFVLGDFTTLGTALATAPDAAAARTALDVYSKSEVDAAIVAGGGYTDSEAITAVSGAMIAGTGIDITTGGSPQAISIAVDQAELKPTEFLLLAASDETTAIVAGTSKITFRLPYAFTVTAVRASLSTAQTSGAPVTVDINEGGASILSTRITIDNGSKTSVGSSPQPVVADASLADDAEITVDIDAVGDGTAKGLKVTLIGHRT
jgi:hypothetical protein